MADSRAVAAVCEAVIALLRNSVGSQEFGTSLDFQVFTSQDFANPIANGVSVYAYRIGEGGTHSPQPHGPERERHRVGLAIELHLLLTAWGQEASLQHSVAGWALHTLHGSPVLPAESLNQISPGAFRADETVQLFLDALSSEELLRIWEALGAGPYQLSLPYVARLVLSGS